MLAKKWLIVGIIALLSVSGALADPAATHPATGEPLVIDCLWGTPVAIDGDLSDWNLAAMTPAVLDIQEQVYTGTWTGPEDLSAEFYMLWDDTNIYMAVVVKDDVLSMDKTDGDIWNADAVEVFFATTNAMADCSEHYQYGFNANEQTWNWCNIDSAGQSAIDYLQVAAVETDDGYICEASIEYGQMTALDFSVGSIIGFHPVLDDTDTADREIQMTWTSREAHDQSEGYGYLVLSEERAIAKELARNPSPANESTDRPLDTTLAWSPGGFAVAHDVYLGTVFDDVNTSTVPTSAGQTETTYDPGLLEYGQTYYWRIDEVNGAPDNTVFQGDVWSFATEPVGYPIEGIIATSNASDDGISVPGRTVDGSGLNAADEHSVEAADMWLGTPVGDDPVYIQYEFDTVYKLHEMLVWNYNIQFEMILGFGLKDVTVEYSENGTDWIVLGDEVLAQATALDTYTANTAVAFSGVAARAVRITVNSGQGLMGQFGLSEVCFLAIPVQAREPEPANGEAGVGIDAALSWRVGRDAISYEVSVGTDPAALPPVDAVSGTSYDPGPLDLATTYSWQVTSLLDTESWAGSVWSFATQMYLVVDDFEAYNDEDNVIYETWVDGWINETGSTVGYLSGPFAETTIVNSGKQSMPLSYDNADVSTAEADLDLGQDWTTNGIQSLSISFQGAADNSGGQLYVKINGTKVAYDGPGADLTDATWQAWSIDLSAVGNVSNVSSLTIGIEGAGASGIVYIDDIRLYGKVPEDITGAGDVVKGVPDDGDWPGAETPDLAIDDDTATKFLHFKGATEPTGLKITPAAGATVVSGITFTTANDAAERDPVTFELYGSNDSIDGPYTLIASGDIVDFAGETEWARFTRNVTDISFVNGVTYTHYQVLFPTVRDPASANSMQIAEVELLGKTAP
jgi:cellulose/xylan binding protein with CBM9 domain